MIRRATLADLESITVIYNEAILEGGFTGDLKPLSIENRRAWFFDHEDRYSIFVKSKGKFPGRLRFALSVPERPKRLQRDLRN